jgi:hypothetical protein
VGVDYAFAPGTEPRLQMLQQLLRDRTDTGPPPFDTKLIEVPGVTTIAEFIHEVDISEPLPVSNLILGSHGNDTGWLEIDLDAKAPKREVTYQILKDAYEDTARLHSLNIPSDMYTKADGTPMPVRVLIKGCRVGQQPKFVDALKKLFGGKLPVIAPRHFYAVRPITKTHHKNKRDKKGTTIPLGQLEHLMYSNELVSKTELKRPALLAAYRAKGFQQYDATSASPNPIPDKWATWLPSEDKLGKKKLPIPYTISLGRKIEELETVSGMAEYRHRPFKLTYSLTNPPTVVKILSGFKGWLSQRPEHQPDWGPTHFPVHEQLGPANVDGSPTTFDQFFDSFTWTRPDKKHENADPFVWTGVRHEYNVLIPVVEPPLTGKSTDQLVYNYFPPRGSGGATITELLVGVAGLFYTSPGS